MCPRGAVELTMGLQYRIRPQSSINVLFLSPKLSQYLNEKQLRITVPHKDIRRAACLGWDQSFKAINGGLFELVKFCHEISQAPDK